MIIQYFESQERPVLQTDSVNVHNPVRSRLLPTTRSVKSLWMGEQNKQEQNVSIKRRRVAFPPPISTSVNLVMKDVRQTLDRYVENTTQSFSQMKDEICSIKRHCSLNNSAANKQVEDFSGK